MSELPRLGLVDPLGLLGQELRRLLAEGALPWQSVTLLAGPTLVGSLTEFAGEPAVVQAIEAQWIADVDALLIAGPVSVEALEILKGSGKLVVDARDVDSDGFAVAPGQRARAKNAWLRLASPATVALLPVIEVIRGMSDLTRFAAVVFEPAAEFGDPGIDELHQQTVETLNLSAPTTSVLGVRRAFDLSPDWASRPERDGRVGRDLAALAHLDPRPEVTLVAAPVFLGLGALVSVEFEDDVGGVEVAAALTEDPRFALCTERPATPGDLPDVADDPIFVGVAPNDGVGRTRIWLACDYMRRCRARAALEVLGDYLRC